MKAQLIELTIALKSKFATLMGCAIALLSPIKYLLILVGLAILLDTIFGIYAAKKNKIKLKSSKLAKFISKMFVYQIVVITMYFLDVQLLGEFLLFFININLLLTKVTAILLIANEGFSIDEKLRMVNKDRGIAYYFKRVLGVAKYIKRESEDLKNDSDKIQDSGTF